MSPEDIRRAVLEREDVARYLREDPQAATPDARERIEAYLDELRTTQRYRFYRALQHPLYPILRKVRRIAEQVPYAQDATARGKVVYVSNHKSHLDYLVEPLVLDDNGIRPPLLAAGINLFGGALGLLHKHVTGAVPIRRNSKDPLYLITLKAYVAELLKTRDLLYYAEGGRSYSGELKTPKTGLLQAALQANRHELSIVPMAVAYDLVLEDRILSREVSRKVKRPFAQEVAEMVRHAVGYDSRAFVTFGEPIPLGTFDPDSRRDLVTLAHRVHDEIGRCYKVLPTALVASVVRPHMLKTELVARLDERLGFLAAAGANLSVKTGRQAAEEGVAMLAARDILVEERHRVRVRDRISLRYYARTIEHLLGRSHRTDPLMLDALPKAAFSALASSQLLKRLASRYGMRRPGSFARRFIAGETVAEAIDAARVIEQQGLSVTLDLLGESVATTDEATHATQAYIAMIGEIERAGIGRNISLKLTQLGLDVDRATCIDNLRRILHAATPGGFFVRIDMENSPYTDATLDALETVWNIGCRNVGTVIQSYLRRSPKDVERLNALGVRVRLVKGAYREPREVAFQQKAEVDAAFVELMHQLLQHGTYPAIATHDPAMIAATESFATAHQIGHDAFEFQMLYGIRRDLQASLSAKGYKFRVYVPFGKEWFPYFMRRLGERPANVGFVLRSVFREKPIQG